MARGLHKRAVMVSLLDEIDEEEEDGEGASSGLWYVVREGVVLAAKCSPSHDSAPSGVKLRAHTPFKVRPAS